MLTQLVPGVHCKVAQQVLALAAAVRRWEVPRTSLPLESWGVGRSVYCGCDESTLADAPVSQGETAGSQQALIDNLGSHHAPRAFQLFAGMHPKPLRGLERCWMQ